MPRRKLSAPYANLHLQDFSRGLVLNRPSATLAPNEASAAKNVVLKDGHIRRRSGWTSLSDTYPGDFEGQPIVGLFPMYGDPSLLLAAVGTKLYATEGLDFQELGGLGGSEDPRPIFTQALGDVYFYSNGADPSELRRFNGESVSDVSGSPSGRMVLYYKQALWCAGNDSDPNHLFWSRQASNWEGVATFPAGNFEPISPGDGDRITGLSFIAGDLIVCKERTIIRISGYPPDNASASSEDLAASVYESPHPGCVAPRTVAQNRNVVVYLGEGGVYAYDGSRALELTNEVHSLFTDLSDADRRSAVGALVESDHYVLSLPTLPLILSIHLGSHFAVTIWE